MATVTASAQLNLTEYCLGNQRDPSATALVVDGGPQYSFAELEHKVLSAAAALGNCSPGSRILIQLPDSFEFVLAFFAANAAGLVPIPASELLSQRERAYMAEYADAVISGSAGNSFGLPHICIDQLTNSTNTARYAKQDAESPAYILFTSGTTSTPKAVVHAQRVVLGRKPMHQQWLGLTSSDRLLHAGALNWSYTLGVGLMDPWCNGATAIVCPGGRDPAQWPEIIARHKATIFAAVPGVYRRLLKYSSDPGLLLNGLRHAVTAGEALSPELLHDWQTKAGIPLYEALGMTECSTYISSGPRVPVQPGCPGKPQAGRQVAVLSEDGAKTVSENTAGLLAIHRREPGLMLGYLQNSPESWRGDWFLTGDRVRQDENGYIHHLGRNSDLMNAQGYRVAPQEIESVLGGCNGVVEMAVAETQVADGLSLIVAYVVVDQHFSDAAFQQLADSELASYKRPRAVQKVDALPRTRNGKLRRAELAALYQPATTV